METGPGERLNLQDKQPAVVEELTRLLERFVADDRSTLGRKLPSDVSIDIWKRA